jgi:succinate dehydrogenase / fumarate reductase cytochrome b subunit
MRYVKHYGTWAYILHRLTGLALTGYLLFHIYLISGLHDPQKFAAEMELFHNPFVSFLEWSLFVVLIFHSLNGIRIFIVDYFNGARYHKPLFTASWILSVILSGVMGLIMFT